MKRMKKPMIAVLLSMLIIMLDISGLNTCFTNEARAATFDEINNSEVFIKQVNGDKQCTLASATMMMRRAAMLMGDTGWADITVGKVMEQAWIEGQGLKHSFTYAGITVSRSVFGADPVNEAISLLQTHPEGIVIYDQIRSPRSHAILLTDYTYGTFYSADPSDAVPVGRIPNSSSLVQVEDAEFCWYVSSPSIAPASPSGTEADDPLAIDTNTGADGLSQVSFPYDEEEEVVITPVSAADILNEIKIVLSKQQIQKGKTTTVKITLPDSLAAVKEYSGDPLRKYSEVRISYVSADKKVASINSSGKITGKKKGTAKIYAIAGFTDGIIKVFELQIKVI